MDVPVEQHIEQVVHVPLAPRPTPPHGDAEVNKVERVVHNPVDLMVEVPRPVVIEKTIEVRWGVV